MSNAIQTTNNQVVTWDNIPEVDFEAIGVPQPKRIGIFWRKGELKDKKRGGIEYLGGWCINAENFNPDMLDSKVWTLTEFVNTDGEVYQNYTTPALECAMIAHRVLWTVGSGKDKTYHTDYKTALAHSPDGKKPSGRTEIVAIVKGVNAPVVLSATGWTSEDLSKAFAQVAQTLSRYAKRNVPPFTVWATLQSQRNANGEPITRKVGNEQNSSLIYRIGADVGKLEQVPQEIFAQCMDALTIVKQWRQGADNAAEVME